MDNFTILPGQVNADAKGSVTTEPAVKTPPVTVPGIDETIAKIKARLESKPATAKTPDPAKPAETTKTDDKTGDEPDPKTIPPKVLAELGRLQKLVRDYEPKVKDLDSFKTDAEMVREVKKLWGGTHEDKMKAIGLISGKDPLDEFVNIVKTYYSLEQEGGDKEAVAPEIKTLSDKLEAAMKKIASLEEGNAKKDEASAKSATEAAQEQANKHVKNFVETNKAKFELCARPENASEAIDLIQSAAIVFMENDGIKTKEQLEKLTQEQAESYYVRAADKVEKEFESIGKRFSKGSITPERDLSRFDRFIRKTTPPTVKVVNEEKSKDPDVAWEQLRKRMHERLEAGEFARK